MKCMALVAFEPSRELLSALFAWQLRNTKSKDILEISEPFSRCKCCDTYANVILHLGRLLLLEKGCSNASAP